MGKESEMQPLDESLLPQLAEMINDIPSQPSRQISDTIAQILQINSDFYIPLSKVIDGETIEFLFTHLDGEYAIESHPFDFILVLCMDPVIRRLIIEKDLMKYFLESIKKSIAFFNGINSNLLLVLIEITRTNPEYINRIFDAGIFSLIYSKVIEDKFIEQSIIDLFSVTFEHQNYKISEEICDIVFQTILLLEDPNVIAMIHVPQIIERILTIFPVFTSCLVPKIPQMIDSITIQKSYYDVSSLLSIFLKVIQIDWMIFYSNGIIGKLKRVIIEYQPDKENNLPPKDNIADEGILDKTINQQKFVNNDSGRKNYIYWQIEKYVFSIYLYILSCLEQNEFVGDIAQSFQIIVDLDFKKIIKGIQADTKFIVIQFIIELLDHLEDKIVKDILTSDALSTIIDDTINNENIRKYIAFRFSKLCSRFIHDISYNKLLQFYIKRLDSV